MVPPKRNDPRAGCRAGPGGDPSARGGDPSARGGDPSEPGVDSSMVPSKRNDLPSIWVAANGSL
jgi:hypothetical protein